MNSNDLGFTSFPLFLLVPPLWPERYTLRLPVYGRKSLCVSGHTSLQRAHLVNLRGFQLPVLLRAPKGCMSLSGSKDLGMSFPESPISPLF